MYKTVVMQKILARALLISLKLLPLHSEHKNPNKPSSKEFYDYAVSFKMMMINFFKPILGPVKLVL
jgi:hypothetical protein